MPTDKQLIASKQKWELKYISSVWSTLNGVHPDIDFLKGIIKKVGHSRIRVYAVLKYLGYHYVPRKRSIIHK